MKLQLLVTPESVRRARAALAMARTALRAAWARAQLEGSLLQALLPNECPGCAAVVKRRNYMLGRWELVGGGQPWIYAYSVCIQCSYAGGHWYQLYSKRRMVEVPIPLPEECAIQGLSNVRVDRLVGLLP